MAVAAVLAHWLLLLHLRARSSALEGTSNLPPPSPPNSNSSANMDTACHRIRARVRVERPADDAALIVLEGVEIVVMSQLSLSLSLPLNGCK